MGAESPVESVLPGPCQKTSLLRPSWPQVSSLDLHRGAPDLQVVIKPAGSTRSCSATQVAASLDAPIDQLSR